MNKYRMMFHLNPFKPVECIGGKVYFGIYYACIVDGEKTLQTELQFNIKRDMGIF